MNKKCQVFTPPKYVIKLLNCIDYRHNLYGKKIIENACGDGNILKIIVERYIEDCLKNNLSLSEIKVGLEQDIYGAEIDEKHQLNCINNLSHIAERYGIKNVKWKILNVDILATNLNIKFDYAVGNPPYITYKELDEKTRQFVKQNFETCKKGKFDYCYAFIEAGLKCLNENGKISYLIPSSIFKNVFAQNLRDFLLPYLSKIFDYKTKKIFNVLTSSAIIVCSKSNIKKNYISYYDVAAKMEHKISKTQLKSKWVFCNNTDAENISGTKVKFGDYFKASITIATLLNEAFVLKNYTQDNDYVYVDDFKIEKKITKLAASPRGRNYKINELIIFPYYYSNNQLKKYDEDGFESKFPNARNYLKKFRSKLKKRNYDNSAKWYEYGRTQALTHLNQAKLLLSTVVTNEVKVYELEKETIPYSGIYVTTHNEQPLSLAKNILESKLFLDYVKGIGTNASGTSLRITPADINKYEFYLEGQ